MINAGPTSFLIPQYDAYGNFPNGGLGKTTLVPNQVTQLNTPSSLGKGPVVFVDGYLQSGNYSPGVSGWKINAAGDVEFSSGTFRLDLVGNTYKTVSTLPTSGTGILINTSGFYAYYNGNNIFGIVGNVIGFANSSGISSAQILPVSGSDIEIQLALGGGLAINSSFIAPTTGATMDLGDQAGTFWANSYVTNYHLGSSSLVFISSGTGSPNGSVTASPGSLYLNKSGGATTTLYVKETGTNTNTGWVAK